MSQNIRFSLLIGALLVSGLAMLFSAFGPWTEKESHYVEQIWRERSKNWSLASRGKLWNQRKALREAGRRLLVPSRGSLDSLDLKWSVIRIHNRSWGEESLKARFQAKAFEPEDWHAEIFERDQNYLHVIESVPVVVNGRSTQYFVQGLIRSEAILPSEIQLSHSRLLVQEKLNPKDSSRDHEQSSRFYLVGDAKSNKQFQLALEKKWQNKEVADSKSDDEEVSFNWIEIMQNNYSRNFAMRVDRLENSPLWLMTMVPESEMVTVSKGSEWKFFTALFLFLLFFISFFYVSYRYIVLRLGSISQVLEPLLNFGQQTEGDSSSKRQFNFSQNRWRLFSLLKGLDQLGNDVHVAHKKRKARMREEIFSQSNIERQTWLEDW